MKSTFDASHLSFHSNIRPVRLRCSHRHVQLKAKSTTLFDTDTTESHLMTSSGNSQGWQLVEVKGTNLTSNRSRQDSNRGGEVVSIRYEQLPEVTGRASSSIDPPPL